MDTDTLQISLPPPPAEPEKRGPPPHYQLWSPKCLLWIGILTSFVFSGIMQGINHGRTGQLRRRKLWIISSIAGYTIFQFLLWIVPEIYVPLIATLVINTIVAVFVGLSGLREFRAHESSGGRRAPVGIPIACVSTSCLILVAFLGAATVFEYYIDDNRLDDALVDLDEGEFESAKPVFQRFIRNYPDDIRGYWNLASLYEDAGELDLAVACLEKGMRRCSDPDDSESYLRSLRTSYETELKQLEELPHLHQELSMENEESRKSAYEILDRMSEEGISARTALELIKLSGKEYPRMTDDPANGPQVRLIDLAAHQYSPISVTAIREMFDIWALPAKSAGLDFLATIESRDAATLFVELVNQCAAMDDPPDLRTGDFDEIPRHVDVLFPELLKYTANPKFRWRIWALCKSLCESGYATEMGPAELSDALLGDFRDQLETVRGFQDAEDPSWIHESVYAAERDHAIMLLDIMEYLPLDKVREALHETVDSPDPRLRCFAVLSLLGHREKVKQPIIDQIADHPATRGLLYKELRRRKRLDLYPDRHESQMALAESDLIHWLSYPSELGREPDEIQFMDTFTVDEEGTGPAQYFMFRFRVSEPHWAAKDGWMAGISGPFERAGGPTADGGGNTFSRFETWESKTPAEHFQSAVNVLDEWRRKGH